jgi:hypothetical protein
MSKLIGFALLAVLAGSSVVAWSHSTVRELPPNQPGISPYQMHLNTDMRALLTDRIDDKWVVSP